VDVIYLVYKGQPKDIERPIYSIGKYKTYIKVIDSCVSLAEKIFKDMQKIEAKVDFELWGSLCSKVLEFVKNVYCQFEDIKTWDNVKRAELAVIVTYEVIFKIILMLLLSLIYWKKTRNYCTLFSQTKEDWLSNLYAMLQSLCFTKWISIKTVRLRAMKLNTVVACRLSGPRCFARVSQRKIKKNKET